MATQTRAPARTSVRHIEAVKTIRICVYSSGGRVKFSTHSIDTNHRSDYVNFINAMRTVRLYRKMPGKSETKCRIVETNFRASIVRGRYVVTVCVYVWLPCHTGNKQQTGWANMNKWVNGEK